MGPIAEANKKKLLERNANLDIVKMYYAYQEQKEIKKKNTLIQELTIEQKIDYYEEIAENCPKCGKKMKVKYFDCLFFYKCINSNCNYIKKIKISNNHDVENVDIFKI